jgi:hypothetical protein
MPNFSAVHSLDEGFIYDAEMNAYEIRLLP